MQKSHTSFRRQSRQAGVARLCLCAGGENREAKLVLDELKDRSKRRYISPVVTAFVYSALGENDQAFALIDTAYDGRDSILVFLKTEPKYDRLRSDPRFPVLMRRVGLPP